MLLSGCLESGSDDFMSFHVLYVARVAVVKSRDMHWSLLAQRDQRDISLGSLRMLIVADGANPCEWPC